MLIFVMPSSYPNDINPQASIFVHEQCVALQKAGCEVVVLDATLFRWKYWFDKTCYRIYRHEKDGINIYSRHTQNLLMNRLFRLTTIRFRSRMKKLFQKAVKDYGMPDLIYAHFTYPSGYVASELAKKNDIPLMVMEHGGFYMRANVAPYLRKILAKTVAGANLFACVSDAQRKCLYQWAGTNKEIKIINNMIDDRFRYFPLRDKEAFTFFSAGNLYKVKRMDLLIRAFCQAFSAEEKVLLKIAGEGEERQLLESLIKKNNREHQILLLGRLNREDMLQGYIDCNVFALASEHESFGIAYREAMAVGRPVIATDNGGISTGWKDSYGQIVSLNDELALAKALRSVYENFESYNLKHISDDCVKNYHSKNVVKNIIIEMKKIIKYNEINKQDSDG